MEFFSSGAAGPVLGGVAGAVMAVGAVYWDVRRRRQEREGRRERPPIREKFLRPPGYSCACRSEGLADQSEAWCMVLLAAGIALGIASFGTLGAVRTFYVQNLGWRELLVQTGAGQVLLLPFLALFSGLAFAHAFRTLGKLRWERACLTLGLRGEQAVAEALGAPEVASAGYVGFHDVQAESRGRQFNLDHGGRTVDRGP